MADGMKDKKRGRRRYVAAFLVGTALTTLGALPAEAAVNDLSRYCTACWRNAHLRPDSWSDCTQEVFCRLLHRVEPESWDRVLADDTEERREFLRAIDAVKKRSQRAHRVASLGADTADEREPQRQQRTELRQMLLRAAREHLSARQCEIIALTLDGWSVREIATRLDLGPDRVSDEKYKAVQKLHRELT